MALHAASPVAPTGTGLRLKAHAIAVPAKLAHLSPALVIGPPESSALLAAISAQDVARGGRLAFLQVGVQLWDRPFAAPGTPGEARLLGSVDWGLDSPSKGYVSVYRAMVTAIGEQAGVAPAQMLTSVLALASLRIEPERIGPAAAPAQDPFRRRGLAGEALLAQ